MLGLPDALHGRGGVQCRPLLRSVHAEVANPGEGKGHPFSGSAPQKIVDLVHKNPISLAEKMCIRPKSQQARPSALDLLGYSGPDQARE